MFQQHLGSEGCSLQQVAGSWTASRYRIRKEHAAVAFWILLGLDSALAGQMHPCI